MNHLSSEILHVFQLGLNVRAPYIEYNIPAFDIPITCHGKDNIEMEKLKEKDNFLLFWGKKNSGTCCLCIEILFFSIFCSHPARRS